MAAEWDYDKNYITITAIKCWSDTVESSYTFLRLSKYCTFKHNLIVHTKATPKRNQTNIVWQTYDQLLRPGVAWDVSQQNIFKIFRSRGLFDFETWKAAFCDLIIVLTLDKRKTWKECLKYNINQGSIWSCPSCKTRNHSLYYKGNDNFSLYA